jgi:hypothetical protein
MPTKGEMGRFIERLLRVGAEPPKGTLFAYRLGWYGGLEKARTIIVEEIQSGRLDIRQKKGEEAKDREN